MTTTNEYQARLEMIRVTRIMASQGLARSSDGNISIRLSEGRFLITPRGLYKMAMEPDDPVIVNEHGDLLEGKPGFRPTTEANMHLEAYKQRPDINVVLHAHPPYATALTIAGIPFPSNVLPEVLIALGDVPTAPYATPGTPALAESIRGPIKDHNTILLSNHGSLSVGKTLEEALIALERLEQTAYTYHLARQLGNLTSLPEAELARLRELGIQRRLEWNKDAAPDSQRLF
jgi:L-fuculose-phosphate aldolase